MQVDLSYKLFVFVVLCVILTMTMQARQAIAQSTRSGTGHVVQKLEDVLIIQPFDTWVRLHENTLICDWRGRIIGWNDVRNGDRVAYIYWRISGPPMGHKSIANVIWKTPSEDVAQEIMKSRKGRVGIDCNF